MCNRILAVLSLFAGLICHPALPLANDSSAEFGIGGLVLARSNSIEIVSEDLYISQSKVSVEYVFRNVSGKDMSTLVAFPTPGLAASSDGLHSVPFHDRDADFVGFKTLVDGVPVKTRVEQRALAAGIDSTDLLKTHGIPLIHYTGAVFAKLKTLSSDIVSDLEKKGLVSTMNGVEPAWMLKTTFYWSQKFPDGKDVKIAHTYTSVSDEATYSPLAENPKGVLANYSENYCLDGAVEKAVKKLNARREKMLNADKIPKFALGRKLAGIHPGDRSKLGRVHQAFQTCRGQRCKAKLCELLWRNVRKISPTQYEVIKEKFYPQNNLRILFIERLSTDN